MSSRDVPRGGGWFWKGVVVVLLASIVVTNVVLLRVASADPSAGVEPDYYRKAAAWDDHVAAQEISDRLGWRADATMAPAADAPGAVDVRVALVDGAGLPISGATLAIEAFAVARSARRHASSGVTDAEGLAVLRVPDSRQGLWELRLQARRGPDAFRATFRRDAPSGER